MFKFSPKSRLMARTKSGVQLGSVVAVEVDQLTGRIAVFLVAANRVLSVISDKVLAIAWNQVLEWQDGEIVVADAAVHQEASNVAMAAPAVPRSLASDAAAPSVQMSDRG